MTAASRIGSIQAAETTRVSGPIRARGTTPEGGVTHARTIRTDEVIRTLGASGTADTAPARRRALVGGLWREVRRG